MTAPLKSLHHLTLPCPPPWDWQPFHAHFALRTIPGVERLEAERYTRSYRLESQTGWFSVSPQPTQSALDLHIHGDDQAVKMIINRVRRMFDLDANPVAIADHLRADEALAPLIESRPGLRLPTAFDPFEQAVRAIVGQQVTVKAAVTLTGRLVDRLGDHLSDAPVEGPNRLFPTPEQIATSNLDRIGMPGKRVETLQGFARAIAEGRLTLHNAHGADELVERLCALPGIGPWTAEYIALRAFGEPDAFPAADLGLLKAPIWGPEGISAKALKTRAEAWRPWRAYAALYLWHSYSLSPSRPLTRRS